MNKNDLEMHFFLNILMDVQSMIYQNDVSMLHLALNTRDFSYNKKQYNKKNWFNFEFSQYKKNSNRNDSNS